MHAGSVIDQLSEGKLALVESQHGNYLPMVRIEKFLQSDVNVTLPADPHPAFVVNGVEIDAIYISQFPYPGIARMTPQSNVTLQEARVSASALGSGFHVLTAWEWSAFVWYQK